MDRVAVISDLHGNLTALQTVLADVDARGISRIVNLGDNVGKSPHGREVIALCQQLCEVNVRGNWDDFLPDKGPEADEALLSMVTSTFAGNRAPSARSIPRNGAF